jgi:hypothetical protein
LTLHVLSSARFSLGSVRRLIFAERITPNCSTSRPLAASAWSLTVALKQQGGKDEDRRCNGFDNEANPGLQHDDMKPPTDASVDQTDARKHAGLGVGPARSSVRASCQSSGPAHR